MKRSILRKVCCAFGWCPFITESNDAGVWGECALGCGKRAGYVSRELLRRHIDRELEDRPK